MELKLKRRRYKSFKIPKETSFSKIENSFLDFYGPGKSKSPNN